jgi:hypothetical protein
MTLEKPISENELLRYREFYEELNDNLRRKRIGKKTTKTLDRCASYVRYIRNKRGIKGIFIRLFERKNKLYEIVQDERRMRLRHY